MDVKPPNFILFPIIGSCFDDEIVILCELNCTRLMDLLLMEGEVEVIRKTMTIDRLCIIRIVLQDKTPSSDFKLYFYYNNRIIYEMDIKYRPTPKSLVFFSCDKVENESDNPLWDRIAKVNPDLIIHGGDNIYADQQFVKSIKYANSGMPEKDCIIYAIKIYRNRYIQTWNRWNKILAPFSHVMGIDDHEIVNNIHQKYKHFNPNEKLISITALTVYDLYQSSLTTRVHKRPDGRFWVKSWTINFENTSKNITLAYFDRQWGTRNMARMEVFDIIPEDTDYLIACTAAAPVASSNIDELTIIEFINKLWEFKCAQPKRKVILISGDSHYYASGRIVDIKSPDISNDNILNAKVKQRCINFIIASPITSQPSVNGWDEMTSLKTRHIGNQYQYDIDHYECRRNFVTCNITEKGFQTGVVFSKDTMMSKHNLITMPYNIMLEKY